MSLAHEALNETVELSKAVAAAVAMTDPKDTLIIVTADHSHGLTINGGARDTSILGLLPGNEDDPAKALDGKAVPVLMYASGPGAPPVGDLRPDLAGVDTADPDLRTFAAVPLYSAAHTGEDIATYATGPGAQGVHGLMDHPAVFEVIRKALALP
jgi:alkaline phosphatase